MGEIQVLDNITIDKIAAGEVVECPASVVKELVENAMDSGATSILVEIKQGGIEFIRVTDNGKGIHSEDIPKAFLRHATSKIRSIEDLEKTYSMGFRGEALASISSVSKVEMITKCEDSLMGNRYLIEGGKEISLEEVGAPNGTTVIVRNLFYNTPARRKFLKSESAEAAHIADILEHLALCRPDISFQFIVNHKNKFATSGNKDLKEVIYRIYGRETAKEIIPIFYEEDGITIAGYLGTPVINRANRSHENYFINRRYIKNDTIAKGIEEAYKAYLMQHKFPFCVLNIEMDTHALDVNVHPAKMEVRFHDKNRFLEFVKKAVSETLKSREMIPNCELVEDAENTTASEEKEKIQPFETKRLTPEKEAFLPRKEESILLSEEFITSKDETRDDASKEFFDLQDNVKNPSSKDLFDTNAPSNDFVFVSKILDKPAAAPSKEELKKNIIKEKEHIFIEKPTQLSFFEPKETVKEDPVLSQNARKHYQLIGQVFNSYWLLTYEDKLYFVDQHAAHEKINYEKLIKRFKENDVVSQQLNPPIIVSLTPKEAITLKENQEHFLHLGFEIEEFGGNEYAIRAIPLELFGREPKEMFLSLINELSETTLKGEPDIITEKIASMACKASVKANHRLSEQEMNRLLDELLLLDNPYHCPHGRPTLFSMSRQEIEKKFKRIL